MTLSPKNCRIASVLWLLVAAAAPAADDILRPEQAFRYTASASAEEVVVRWRIEPAHYLYKSRMGYASLSDGVRLGEPVMPAGIPYEDEFFGRMEIYRDVAEIGIPITYRAAGAGSVELEIRSQGCADIGLCYPPQVWTTTVQLPGSGPAGRLDNLLDSSRGGFELDEPLPPDQAFQADVEVIDPFQLQINWMIADGYYLYRDSLAVSSDGETARAGPPVIPRGVAKWDEHFGDTEVFYEQAIVKLPLSRSSPAPADLLLTLSYQGCKEDSICYPPQQVTLDVRLPLASADDGPALAQLGPADAAGPLVSEQDRLSSLIVSGHFGLVLATFLGLGLLLSFTPCVLPMVPILSGIIAGQGEQATTGRAFALSLTYVLGMALTYTVAGAAFAAAGGQLQAALQKPWIIIGVAMLFVGLALSMFGLYELQMPAFIQNRLTAAGNRQKRGSYVGTAALGALSALVVTTCVAPPLVASLTVIAQAGDVVRGALSLFALSIGMGIPLLVIGTSAGKFLPRAGIWMDAVKAVFGFLMLGLAIWMLDRILPATITMLLWASLAIVAGVWFGAFDTLEPHSPGRLRAAKGVGLIASLYGAVLLVGALAGSTDMFQPLRGIGIGPGDSVAAHGVEFKRIKTVADLNRELAAAQAAGQPVMLDFYADWCVSCKEMERFTFSDVDVQNALRPAVLLQADVTANDAEDQALLDHFGIFGPPTIMFFTKSGEELVNFRVVGYMPASDFASHTRQAFGISMAAR